MNSIGLEIKHNTDNASIMLRYTNGSNAIINYFSNGSKQYSKERIEIFSEGRNLILDNWRKLNGYGFKNFNSYKIRQDKGYLNQFKILLDNDKSNLITFKEIVNTTEASLAAIESIKKHKWIDIKS